MIQWPCNKKHKNQLFEISHSADKGLVMRAVVSGLCVSVWGGAQHDLANMVQASYVKGAKYQEFNLKKQKDGSYEIKTISAGKCLEVEGASKGRAMNILQVIFTLFILVYLQS